MDEPVELLLHPVRWQIVQQLARSPLTPRQLGRLLPQVAQATLYRQVQVLVSADLVRVAGEEQVRGAVEKTYTLAPLLASPQDTVEGRRRQAMLVLALLQSDVDAGLSTAVANEPLEGFTLTRTLLHMTAEERTMVQDRLTELFTPLLTPRPGTRPHALGMVLAPQPVVD